VARRLPYRTSLRSRVRRKMRRMMSRLHYFCILLL
jgi:hypothetical protein